MAEVASESKQGTFRRFLGFDGQGGLQLIGGLVIGLIAFYSSYDHVNFLSSSIQLNQLMGSLAHFCLVGGCSSRT